MRKVLLLFVAMSAGLLVAADKTTYEGTISDAMCGAKHSMSGMSDRDCNLGCVKKGSKFALVADGKVYTLEGKSKDLEKFAGGKAKVTGTLKGETISVSAVAKAD